MFFFGCEKTSPQLELTGSTMGTYYRVLLIEPENGSLDSARLHSDIERTLKSLNASLSTWIPNSEISLFNKSTSTEPVTVSDGFYKNLQVAQEISEETNGIFDVTIMPLVNLWGFGWKGVPKEEVNQKVIDSVMTFVGYKKLHLLENNQIKKDHPKLQIDVASLAKGYGVDEVAKCVSGYGVDRFLVEIGGEMVTRGLNSKQQKWRAGVEKPDLNQPYAKSIQQILQITDKAFATSGNYRRFYELNGKKYAHTMNPKTGRPAQTSIASVTVIANDCMTADALATMLMAMDIDKGLTWVNSKKDIEALFILHEKEGFTEIYSDGFKQYIN